MVWNLWNAKALARAPLSLEKIALVADAIYRRCGNADGLVDDPRTCDVKPARDLPTCATDDEGAGCVTPGQIRALETIYGAVVIGGQPYFPGVPLGAEKAGRQPGGGGWSRRWGRGPATSSGCSWSGHVPLPWRHRPRAVRRAHSADQLGRRRSGAQQIVADQEEGGVVVGTRPLCPYPQVARYNDAGLRTDATSFVCRDPS